MEVSEHVAVVPAQPVLGAEPEKAMGILGNVQHHILCKPIVARKDLQRSLIGGIGKRGWHVGKCSRWNGERKQADKTNNKK